MSRLGLLVLRRCLRVAAGGMLAAALAVGLGGALERARFGVSDRAALAKIEAEVQRHFDLGSAALADVSRRAADARGLIRRASRDTTAAQGLFTILADAIPTHLRSSAGVTVYDAALNPLAWAGRVFDVPRGRTDESGALFVEFGPFGPRLVRVDALVDRERPTPIRDGLVVAEQRVGRGESLTGSDDFVLTTAIAPVSIGPQEPTHEPVAEHAFAIRGANGTTLAYGTVRDADLLAERARWKRGLATIVAILLVLTLSVCVVVVLEPRREHTTRAQALWTMLAAIGLIAGARGAPLIAKAAVAQSRLLDSPVDVGLTALALLAVVWLALDTIDSWRVGRRRCALLPATGRTLLGAVGAYAAAGAFTAGLVVWYGRLVQQRVADSADNLLHLSLHPLDFNRLVAACGLILAHAAVVWAGAGATKVASLVMRRSRSTAHDVLTSAAWATAALVTAARGAERLGRLPLLPLLIATGCAALLAWATSGPRGPRRRLSQAARLGRLYLALVLPSVAMYPLLLDAAADAKEALVAHTFGPAAIRQRDDLKARLSTTLEQIDGRAGIGRIVEPPDGDPPDADLAFQIWRATDLSTHRLTSAIEVYGPNGRLASRFALRLPQTAPASVALGSCTDWDFSDEVSAVGSSERHVLRASRGVCVSGRRVGALVVRVMLDYRTLPFTSAEVPYVASLGPDRGVAAESRVERDVEFVAYGWSRAPLYSSGSAVWSLSDEVFERLVQSRVPFWQTIARGDGRFRVYFLSDRGGIYALGYPMRTLLAHIVNVAELLVLIGLLYLALLAGTMVLRTLARSRSSGYALLREVRSSFYRKLLVAFVGAAIAPVFVLALATRTYFAAQAQAGVQADAIETVTVAQRLVEDYATLQRRGAGALEYIDDQTMVIVGRAIDQPVHLFSRSRLRATSERDLFASGLLTTRASADVYRRIVLDRLPTFVGVEDIGGSEYLVAAAPVRLGDREGIVTIPATLRQQEIDAQIDELDRRVLSAAVLFALLGTAIGYWMAERIADPVNRLTRATRRIARGDLDARIAATSSDELKRLVDDFNHMAADLKRQRTELERTQRLEAWADMARQVAHDIKNPLTPIQLSAEHARRVNLDRGRPLSPVLDECVTSILSQVRLLRQIAAEFSSFASSPVAKPEPTDLWRLIEEVVEPYRTGLDGRIAITTDVAPDVPTLLLDRTLFARALTNVIENALHAMPGPGRLAIDAGSTSAADRREVDVSIRDTGMGMDAEALSRLFEPYFSTKATGTGLGLTIAKRNVELNGGHIAVKSEKGAGTTVTISLPVTTVG